MEKLFRLEKKNPIDFPAAGAHFPYQGLYVVFHINAYTQL